MLRSNSSDLMAGKILALGTTSLIQTFVWIASIAIILLKTLH